MSYSNVITNQDHVANQNPIRYRGYYYDTESGLYYLNSRYYDPVTGRFVNADGYVSTGQDITGFNMFAYCGNNPVNRADSSGEFWFTALCVVAIITVCAVAFSGCSQQTSQPTSSGGSTKRKDLATRPNPNTGAHEFDIGKGWTARIDHENSSTLTKKHIHVQKNELKFSQNIDGSPHDGSSGSPPNSVKKQLKKQLDWDWDKKDRSWKNSQDSTILHCCSPEEQAMGECECYSSFVPNGPYISGISGGGGIPAPAVNPWYVIAPVG